MVRRLLWPAATGVLSAAFGVAGAELLAAATAPQAAPLIAVGGAVIDATPTPVKEFAVRELGTNDKPVLLASIALVLALFTAIVGIITVRYRPAAVIGATMFGLAGAIAALSRPTATVYDAVPSVLGAALAGVTLLVLTRRAYPTSTQPSTDGEPPPPPTRHQHGDQSADTEAATPASETPTPDETSMIRGADGNTRPFDRRAFLRAAAMVAGATAAAGAGSQLITRARGGAAAQSRDAIKLPTPADPAKPLPAGVGAGFTTPNTDFYRVDTALTVPTIDVGSWSLRIHGMVDHELELSFADLLNRPLIERDITLNCVSNEVGGPYIGTARWLGVPLVQLLREAGAHAGADQVVARSSEGMTIGTPVQTVLDGRDTMLCLAMNGQPLPAQHGFPVRMLTPGLYGYAGACKWITDIELTTFDAFDAYWVKRGWSAQGPVKTASRIDKPAPLAQLSTNTTTTIAGVAWAQHRGINTVEIRIDNGTWEKAELLPVPSIDTWVQWRHPWKPSPGQHTITVRATDATGTVQTEQRATPFPNGATGWHNIIITAS